MWAGQSLLQAGLGTFVTNLIPSKSIFLWDPGCAIPKVCSGSESMIDLIKTLLSCHSLAVLSSFVLLLLLPHLSFTFSQFPTLRLPKIPEQAVELIIHLLLVQLDGHQTPALAELHLQGFQIFPSWDIPGRKGSQKKWDNCRHGQSFCPFSVKIEYEQLSEQNI